MDEYTLCEESYKNGYNRGYEQGKKDAMKWHSVIEEPPEDKQILIKTMWSWGADYFLGYYSNNFGFWSGAIRGKMHNVVGWMEIPE